MNHKEMSEIFAIMLLAYPNAEVFKGGIQKLGPTINLWVTSLPDVDFWIGQQAAIKLCRECKFPPTIAEFREKAEAIKGEVRKRIDAAKYTVELHIEVARQMPQDFYNSLSADSLVKMAIDDMGGPDKLISHSLYRKDDAGTPKKICNYSEFDRSCERVLRQAQLSSRPSIGKAKQIGGKTT